MLWSALSTNNFCLRVMSMVASSTIHIPSWERPLGEGNQLLSLELGKNYLSREDCLRASNVIFGDIGVSCIYIYIYIYIGYIGYIYQLWCLLNGCCFVPSASSLFKPIVKNPSRKRGLLNIHSMRRVGEQVVVGNLYLA